MTNDKFTDAALAEAEVADGMDEWSRECFMSGAEWARTHLAAQEPTDAEIEAAAEALVDACSPGNAWEHLSESIRETQRADARAALSAARAARRDEETR